MQIQPYLFFDGCCERAVEFYRQALGAEVVMLMRYRDSPDPLPPGVDAATFADRIMHVTMTIGDAVIMASDECIGNPSTFGGFSLSLGVPDRATADRFFAALADGGQIVMPLGKTFWSPCFGMLTDRFGVQWMVNQDDGTTGAGE